MTVHFFFCISLLYSVIPRSSMFYCRTGRFRTGTSTMSSHSPMKAHATFNSTGLSDSFSNSFDLSRMQDTYGRGSHDVGKTLESFSKMRALDDSLTRRGGGGDAYGMHTSYDTAPLSARAPQSRSIGRKCHGKRSVAFGKLTNETRT